MDSLRQNKDLNFYTNSKLSDMRSSLTVLRRFYLSMTVKKYSDISKFLFWDEGTIRNYRKRYLEGGILGLVTDVYAGKRCHLSDKEKEQLSNYPQTKLCMDIFRQWIYGPTSRLRINI
jgi:hypothetical protein